MGCTRTSIAHTNYKRVIYIYIKNSRVTCSNLRRPLQGRSQKQDEKTKYCALALKNIGKKDNSIWDEDEHNIRRENVACWGGASQNDGQQDSRTLDKGPQNESGSWRGGRQDIGLKETEY